VLFDAGHVESAFILFIHSLRFGIDETVHGIFGTGGNSALAIIILWPITSHTGSATGAAALTFIMSSKSITACEPTPTLRTDMWTLSGMELRMSLEIMESPKARLASLTYVRLLLAVGEKMALEVMMSGELGGTVRTTMFFGRR
jgi:hypothetical protein